MLARVRKVTVRTRSEMKLENWFGARLHMHE